MWLFQSRTGSTGHLAINGFSDRSVEHNPFQSRTGSTGHLARENWPEPQPKDEFQSRTGSTGHLAVLVTLFLLSQEVVSIPNGLHRPFSPRNQFRNELKLVHFSIPNGLHRPFSPIE